jgi:hypothetical protein
MSLTVFPNRHSCAAWVGALAGLLAILGYADRVTAQSIPIPVPLPMQSPRSEAQQFLFVNPLTGKDTNAGDTQRSPFRTITHALRSAQPNNTVIMLAIGTYTGDTGESFPLMIPAGVQLQGDPGTKGESIVIQGGGSFRAAECGDRRSRANCRGDHQQPQPQWLWTLDRVG